MISYIAFFRDAPKFLIYDRAFIFYMGVFDQLYPSHGLSKTLEAGFDIFITIIIILLF